METQRGKGAIGVSRIAPNEKQGQRAKAMQPRHCLIAHPPNPPFQPTRVDVWRVHSGSFRAGG